MAAGAGSIARQRIYDRLVWRNRVVSVLRLLVPGLGAIALAGLSVALYIANIAGDFSIGSVTLDRDTLIIDAPRHSGLMADGGIYQLEAATARAAITNLDVLFVTDGKAVLQRPDGVEMRGTATTATLDGKSNIITITGRADIADSRGVTGWLERGVIDYPNEHITTTGPVQFDLEDGSRIEGATMDYDQKARIWQFTGVTLTLPATPGELL